MKSLLKQIIYKEFQTLAFDSARASKSNFSSSHGLRNPKQIPCCSFLPKTINGKEAKSSSIYILLLRITRVFCNYTCVLQGVFRGK